jgi:uncharacterized protein (DUF1778 family)
MAQAQCGLVKDMMDILKMASHPRMVPFCHHLFRIGVTTIRLNNMTQSQEATERVTARVSVSIRETLKRAADLSGATLNQFMVQAALKEAHKILEDERLIILSEQDANKIFELIENPPTPTARLEAAVRNHRTFLSESR